MNLVKFSKRKEGVAADRLKDVGQRIVLHRMHWIGQNEYVFVTNVFRKCCYKKLFPSFCGRIFLGFRLPGWTVSLRTVLTITPRTRRNTCYSGAHTRATCHKQELCSRIARHANDTNLRFCEYRVHTEAQQSCCLQRERVFFRFFFEHDNFIFFIRIQKWIIYDHQNRFCKNTA